MLEMFDIPSDIRSMLNGCHVEDGELVMDTTKLVGIYDTKEMVHNQTRFIVEREAEIKAYEEQIERLKKRIDEEKVRVSALRSLVANTLREQGIKAKFADVHAYTRLSKSVIVENVEVLPPELVTTKTTISPNKLLLRERIEAGDSFEGVTLSENLSLTIK